MSHLYAVLATVNDDRWDHMDGWGGGWMWLWGLAMMALFAVLIVWLMRSTTGGQGQSPRPSDPTDRAREVLAERYARGELTTEEYQERVEQLR
ncbi:MAG: SHOCT domain-containing protein [Acidimicrobiales bacterium]